ncbi:MAG: hypothetical protein R3E08_14450 [Thiotrichaceae bacterium]
MHVKGQGALIQNVVMMSVNTNNILFILKQKTVLAEQYVIGKILGQGGFGVTYLGFDLWLQKRLRLKIFAALAMRDFTTANIIPLKKQEGAFAQGLVVH